MGKKQLVKEIIGSLMEEKGFSVVEGMDGRNKVWVWEKEVDGVRETVDVMDYRGMSMEIGISKFGVMPGIGHNLLRTLDHPRTTEKEWSGYARNKREGLYEDILLDMRDILIILRDIAQC